MKKKYLIQFLFLSIPLLLSGLASQATYNSDIDNNSADANSNLINQRPSASQIRSLQNNFGREFQYPSINTNGISVSNPRNDEALLKTNGVVGPSPITTLATTIDIPDHLFNETYEIQDVLESGSGTSWPSETVRLFRTSNLSKQLEINTLTWTEITTNSDYEDTGLSSTTDLSDGSYLFDVTFTSADIDVWIYFVHFNGTAPFKQAGVVFKQIIAVSDYAEFTVIVDKNNVGPSETYTYNITATTLSGFPLTGLTVTLLETYGVQQNANAIDDIFALDAPGTKILPSIYGDPAPWPGTEDTISFSVSVTPNQDTFNHTVFPTLIQTPSITVTTDYTFTATGSLGGTPLTDPNSKFYRSGQLIVISGAYANQSFAGDQATWDAARDNHAITVAVTGADPSATILTLGPYSTNTSGTFEFNFTFSVANFPDLNLLQETEIVITVTIDATNVADKVETFLFKVKEDLGTLTTSGVSPEVFYHPGSPSITITGTVLDSKGSGAKFVPIVVSINNKTTANSAWNSQLIEAVYGTTVTTDGGVFSLTITNFNFAFSRPTITINVTIGTIGAANDWTSIGISMLTNETSSFDYYSSITTSIGVDLKDGNGLRPLNVTNNVLNDTYVTYYNNLAEYSITVIDEFGRNPTGLLIEAYGLTNGFLDKNGSEKVKAGQNTFTFLFNNFTTSNQLLFNTSGVSFSYRFVIAEIFPSLKVEEIETFVLYGPDNVAPAFDGIPFVIGENTGNADDIVIEVTLDNSASGVDNIQFVIIYYKLSNEASGNVSEVTFPLTYQSANMIYQILPVDQYWFTIPFVENGIWVEFYVEVVDYAGYGLFENGVTNIGNTYGWNTNFTLNVSSSIDQVKMGDTEIINDGNFDLTEAITVNDIPLDQNTNVNPGENLKIDLYLPADNGIQDYANVSMAFQIRIYFINGTLNQVLPFTNVTMNQLGLVIIGTYNGNYRYQYVIVGTTFQYYYQINYLFNVTDPVGNNYITQEIINLIGVDEFNTFVADDDNPENPDPTRDLQFEETVERNNTITLKQVYNETETATVTYNITDTGIGIGDIWLWLYYYNELKQQYYNDSVLLVQNGTIMFTGILPSPSSLLLWLSQINNGTLVNVTETGGFYFVAFEIDFTGLEINSTVSWELIVTDIAGNEITVNPQGQDLDLDPFRFEVIHPPIVIVPDIDVTQTIDIITTTDADGNTIVITSTIQLFPDEEKDSGNALLIILVFSVLLFGLTLYYQRHNIKEYFERSARKRKAKSTLSELIDEIKRLGAEERYKSAIKLVWEALERLSKEILQVPRSSTQTAREFASYLSTVTIVDRETLITISNAFESAKYGKDEPTYDDWDDAVKALDITVNTIIESGARVQIEDDDDDFD